MTGYGSGCTSPRSERALVDRPALASRAPPPTGSRCRFPSSGTSQAPRDGPLSTGGKYARRPHYPILAGLTRSCRWAYPAGTGVVRSAVKQARATLGYLARPQPFAEPCQPPRAGHLPVFPIYGNNNHHVDAPWQPPPRE